ncbi:MAG: response regulator [Anaerolineae bacterium]|jgi:two-component system KDP operon response regulator KdpE|nr:response regulator [Anaerolineae bacterium]
MNEPGHPRILIVDDEQAIRRFLRASLTAHGYAVQEAATGEDALRAVVTVRPDILILDLGLPDIDGVEVTRRLREWSAIPVLILSVRGDEADKILALDAGADDYLTKPFGVGELLARLRVALRHRAPAPGDPLLAAGDLSIDLARRLVLLAGEPVQLTPTEYDLLRVLLAHAGKVLTHRQLLREVWGAAYEAETHLLRVNISNLRRKIEPEPARPRYILSEPGIGYRLRES